MNQHIVRPITSYRSRNPRAGLRNAARQPEDQPKPFIYGPIIYEEANRKCPTCGSHDWIYSGEIATCYPAGHATPRYPKKDELPTGSDLGGGGAEAGLCSNRSALGEDAVAKLEDKDSE